MKWLAVVAALIVFAALFVARAARSGELPAVGKPAPDFNLPDQNGKQHTLQEYRGKWLVLYFYPKDDTPGCTQEACAFRDDLSQIAALGAQVVGVSVDDTSSHAEFAKKYHLPFPLLADKTDRNGGALWRADESMADQVRAALYILDRPARQCKQGVSECGNLAPFETDHR